MSTLLAAPKVKLPTVGLKSSWTELFLGSVTKTLDELEFGTVLGLQLFEMLQRLETPPVQV
jgi:hypothetical protein